MALVTVALWGCSTPSAPAPTEPTRDPLAEHRLHRHEAWQELAKRYDADQDGRIERGEYPRGDAPFGQLDRDRDGAVSEADFALDGALPPDFGIPLLLVRFAGGAKAASVPIEPLIAALAGLDRDGDGRVDVAEFNEVLARGAPPGVDGFGTLLAGMDADRDRLLSRTEIAQWLERRDAQGDGMLELRERMPGLAPLQVGWIEHGQREPAPDFPALRLEDLAPVRLSELRRGKPMALIFGSFT